jgi:hypothetical protein
MQRTSYKPLPMARMREPSQLPRPAEAGPSRFPAIDGHDRLAPGRARDDPRGSDACQANRAMIASGVRLFSSST